MGQLGILLKLQISFRFLLSTLAKYKHHFEIAFSIYDRDCNGCIELSEFIQVQNSMLGNVPELLDPRTTGVKSSLLVHLFGSDGKGTLSFEEFSRFIDAFQKEVMLFEFNVYAKGNKTISFDDFASLVMRYGRFSLKEIQVSYHFIYRILNSQKGGKTDKSKNSLHTCQLTLKNFFFKKALFRHLTGHGT